LGGGKSPLAVARLADDLEAVLEGEEGAQPFADDGVIVDEQDANRVSQRRPPAGR
jgi:hypothetical protein